MLTFACVAANHMGLISAAESMLGRKIPVLNCPKCCTFWSVLWLSVLSGRNMVSALALSFLCAYIAIWLELFMGYIDTLYNRLYEKIYSATDTDNSNTADADVGNTNNKLSDMQEK